MIINYNKYVDVLKITEALKSFPLFLSERLRNILSNIDHEISSDLLSLHSDLESRVSKTFIDIHDEKSNTFTFSQPNKVVRVLDLDITNDEELANMKTDIFNKTNNIQDDNDVYTTYRSEIKIGGFIRDIFGTTYPESITGGQNKHDIESFVNLYKAEYNKDEKTELLDIVKGDDIAFWYNCSKYFDGGGSLGGSCMRSVGAYYFDIYTKNPEKVSMLILYSDKSKTKIKGRAILWKLDKPEGRIFMDRVYTCDYSDEQVFINYAIEKNWIYKESQSMGSDIYLIDINSGSDHPKMIDMVVTLSSKNYGSFPYCDTMTFLNSSTNELSNTDGHEPSKVLIDTQGSYSSYDDYDDDYGDDDDYEYSEYEGNNIPRDEAKYCEFGQDWVRTSDAIRVFNVGPITYATPNYPGLAEQKVTIGGETKIKHFLESDCVWSDYLNTWLFKPSAVNVWIDKEKEKWVLEHKKRKDETFYRINGENYISDLVDTENMKLK